MELNDEHTWCTGNEDIAEGECAGHDDVLCLGFDPLDRDMIQPSSIDVRLDRFFRLLGGLQAEFAGSARAKGLSVGWDKEITYRRADKDEAGLVAKAEQLHMENRERINLDAKPAAEEYEPF